MLARGKKISNNILQLKAGLNIHCMYRKEEEKEEKKEKHPINLDENPLRTHTLIQ